MKPFAYIVFIFLMVFLSGCSDEADSPPPEDITGEVTSLSSKESRDGQISQTRAIFHGFNPESGFTGYLLVGMDGRGNIYRVDGDTLLVSSDSGDTWKALLHSEPPPRAVHRTQDDWLLVSVMEDRFSPHARGSLWLSQDEGASWTRVLNVRSGGVIFWGFAETGDGSIIYVSEYGYRGLEGEGNARRLYGSEDGGISWEVLWEAPHESGVHIHRIAVDPYHQDRLWLSMGDSPVNSSVQYSDDRGKTWTVLTTESQAPAFVFTETHVYFGRDLYPYGVFRWDRTTGEIQDVLNLASLGLDTGPIYTMVRDGNGLIYASTIRYEENTSPATLWVSADGENWHLLDAVEDAGGGYQRLFGPDNDGYIFARYWSEREGKMAVRFKSLDYRGE